MRWGAILFCAIGLPMVALMLACGMFMDDYQYQFQFVSSGAGDMTYDLCRSPQIRTAAQAFRSYWDHYLSWGNGRLGTLLMYLSLLLPLWTVKTLTAVVATVTFWLTSRLGVGETRRRPLRALCVCIVLWIALPWHDSVTAATTYALNYIWPGALNLALLFFMEREQWHPQRRRLWWLLPLALCAAMMHEGLAPAMAVALVCVCLVQMRRGVLSRPLLWITAVYALGMALVLFCPSTITRSHGTWQLSRLWYAAGLFANLLPRAWPLFVAWLILVLRRGRGWGRIYMLLIGASVGAVALYVNDLSPERGYWLVNLFSVIVIFRLLPTRDVTHPGWWRSALAGAGFVGIGVWLLSVACIQRELTEERAAALRQVQSDDTSMVFAACTPRDGTPWWTLSIPRMLDFDSWNAMCYTTRRSPRRHLYDRFSRMIILPPHYRGLTLEQLMDSLPCVPGTAGLHGVYPYFRPEDGRARPYRYTFGTAGTDGFGRWDNARRRAHPYAAATALLLPQVTLTGIWVDWTGVKLAPPASPTDTTLFMCMGTLPRSLWGRPLLRVDTLP